MPSRKCKNRQNLQLLYFKRLKKHPDISLEVPHTSQWPLKPTEKDIIHNFTSFQNIFMKELEAIKDFTKSFERKFQEPEKAIICLSEPKISNCNESSPLTVELLKNKVSTLENLFDWKRFNHKFSAQTK